MNRQLLRRVGLTVGSTITALAVVSIWGFQLKGDDTYLSLFLFVVGVAIFTFSAPAIQEPLEPSARGFDVIVQPAEPSQDQNVPRRQD